MCPLRVESLFATVLWLPVCEPCSSSVLDILEAVFLCSRVPGLRAHYGSWILLLEQNFCRCDYPAICGLPTQGCGSCLHRVSTPLFISLWFLISELWKIFSANLQVILINSCSKTITCHLGVPTWGDKLRSSFPVIFVYPYIYLFIFYNGMLYIWLYIH